MEKEEEENYSVSLPVNYTGLDDYPQDHCHQFMKLGIGENSSDNNVEMVDYVFNNPPPQHISSGFCTSTSLDRSSFTEVMQFADFGPKLALNQTKNLEEENGIDPIYFLKFRVLNDELQDQTLMDPPVSTRNEEEEIGANDEERNLTMLNQEEEEEEEARNIPNGFLGGNFDQNPTSKAKNRRKRSRSVVKTREEVESQRMTHIAVERNRRKQMNEHLRVLRSLMPSSYVQRGDQASIVGGAIEFVRELEQLLQCLESQKRRRILGGDGEAPRLPMGDLPSSAIQQPQPPFFSPILPLPNDQIKLIDLETGLHEETAESKSFLADVEVKLLGFDAMIKILSRRRPGQLLQTITALEDMQLNILHTNITTIEQTVLYSFNVKVENEMRFTAEDIANSVQQIFNFIHASITM